MIWEDWITGVGTILGMDVTTAGIVISLLFSSLFFIVGLLASRRGAMGGVFLFIAFNLIFTLFGWLHYWITLLFVLLTVGLYSRKMTKWFGGD